MEPIIKKLIIYHFIIVNLNKMDKNIKLLKLVLLLNELYK